VQSTSRSRDVQPALISLFIKSIAASSSERSIFWKCSSLSFEKCTNQLRFYLNNVSGYAINPKSMKFTYTDGNTMLKLWLVQACYFHINIYC
jgi:hypothetical protein